MKFEKLHNRVGFRYSILNLMCVTALFAIAVTVIFPQIITGKYATIRVTSIVSDGKSGFDIAFDYLITGNTGIRSKFFPDCDECLYIGGGRYLSRFCRGSTILHIDGIDSLAGIDFRSEIKISEGDEVDVLAGRPLVLFNFLSSDGEKHFGCLELCPLRSTSKRQEMTKRWKQVLERETHVRKGVSEPDQKKQTCEQ